VQHITEPGPNVPTNDPKHLVGRAADSFASPDRLAAEPGGPSAADRVAALRDLAQVLVEPGVLEHVLARALDVSARLMPVVERWEIFVTAPGGPGGLRLAAVHGADAAHPDTAGTPRSISSLGYGAAVDLQVLRRRTRAVLDHAGHVRPARRAGELVPSEGLRSAGVCAPLVDYQRQLHGALVATARPGAPLGDQDLALLDTVTHFLAAIVAQRARTDTAPRPETEDGARDARIEFISLAAHELRSPLTSVKGYAQLLLRAARRAPGFSESQLRALQSIEQQASRMSDMVAELLDAARIERGTFELQPRPVDLAGLARRAVEQRRPSLERHDLLLETDAVALVGRWDPQRLEQVIRDLIDNAIRFSPDGGAVTVRVSHAEHLARLCVSDQGIGIPADERERIFEAFYRGAIAQKRNLSGLGLGLFVSRAIIQRLGGRLWLDLSAESEAAHPGSQFCMELPLAGGEAAPLA
jgi:signal transduction histidine kinase